MEKLTHLPNGQWQLEKAVPSLEASPYDMKVGDDYTGKDAKKAQANVLKELTDKPHKAYKTMINPDTGKKEMHILVHRGMKETTKDAERMGGYSIGIDKKNRKMEHTTHAVHTLDHTAAAEYGDVHSFWVPINQVSSMTNYMRGRFKDKTVKIPDQMINEHSKNLTNEHNDLKDIIHQAKSEGVSDEDKKLLSQLEEKVQDLHNTLNDPKKLEDSARKDLSRDPHSKSQQHIVVKPGSYNLATKDELQAMDKDITDHVSAVKNGKKSMPEDWQNWWEGRHPNYTPMFHPNIKHKTYE